MIIYSNFLLGSVFNQNVIAIFMAQLSLLYISVLFVLFLWFGKLVFIIFVLEIHSFFLNDIQAQFIASL